MSELEQEIRRFIADTFLLTDDATAFSSGDSLTRTGVMDSVGIVELMLFLETNCGVHVSDDEAVPENLDTVANIVRYVTRKLQTSETDFRADLIQNVA